MPFLFMLKRGIRYQASGVQIRKMPENHLRYLMPVVCGLTVLKFPLSQIERHWVRVESYPARVYCCLHMEKIDKPTALT